MTNRVMSFQLPEELAQLLERRSSESGKNLSTVVTEALTEAMLPPDEPQKPLISASTGFSAVAASEQQAAAIDQILSAFSDLIFVQDRLGRFIYINSAAANAFGNERSYFLGKTFQDLNLPEEVVTQLSLYHQEVFNSQQSVSGSSSFSIYQNVRDYEFLFSPIQANDGCLNTVVVIAKDITERQRTQMALQESEELYRSLFDAANDSIIISDLSTGRLLDANWSAVRQLGYSRRELLQMTVNQIEAPMSAARRISILQKLQADGTIIFEHVYRCKNGTEIPVEVSAQVIEYENRLAIQSFARDITERRRAEMEIRQLNAELELRVLERTTELRRINQDLANEIADRQQIEAELREKEEQLRRTLDLTHIGLWDWHIQTDELIWSENTAQLFGLIPDRVQMDAQAWSDLIHLDDRNQVWQMTAHALATRSACELEYRVIWHDGSTHWILDKGHGIYDKSGQAIRMVGVVIDITDRKEAEAALYQSEERYRAVIEDQTEIVTRFLPDGTLTFVNAACCRKLGKTREELIGQNFLPIVLEADRQALIDYFTTFTPEDAVKTSENRGAFLNGEICWHQWTDRAFFDQYGKLIEFQSVGRDVTDRRQAEEKLLRSEAMLAAAQQVAHLGSWEFDLKSQKLTWSEETFRLFGFDPTMPEPSLPELFQCIPASDRFQVQEQVKRSIAEGIPYQREYQIIRPDGSIRQIESRGEVALDDRGQVRKLFGAVLDITDRKQTEQALRQREQELSALIEHAPDVISRCDRNFRFLYINARIKQEVGIPSADFIGKTSLELGFSEEKISPWHAVLQRAFETGQEQSYEFDFSSLKGKTYWFNRVVPEFAEDGTVTSVLVVARDVTELKQTELALRESEERFRSIFEQATVGIVQFDASGQFLRVNPQFCSIVGYTAAELLEKTCLEITHSDDLKFAQTCMNQMAAGQIQTFLLKKRYLCKDGQVKWVKSSALAVRNSDDVFLYAVAVVENLGSRVV